MALEQASDPCATCAKRLDTQDNRRGYCEGCPRLLRRCPACGQFVAQKDWGWGLVGVTFSQMRWTCAGCKLVQPRELPARFTCRLTMADRPRLLLAGELELAASRLTSHPVVGPLVAALARQVCEGAEVDVDVSAAGERDRRWVLKTLRDCCNRLPAGYADAAEELTRKWGWSIPPPEGWAGTFDRRPPSPAQDAVRLGWERPA